MASDEHIKLEKVRKSYGKKEILKGVDLSVRKGDVLALVGPSGSGKSTILRCINRLVEIDSGKISVDGRDIRSLDPLQLRRQVILMPQNSVMFPGTVLDNVLMPMRALGKEDRKRAITALRDAGVPDELFERDASRLSGGEMKRVALARAIALRPKALLLDEPTAGIDPKKVELIESTILDMVRKRGVTVIWVTHDREQALRVGDAIASIKEGKVTKMGRKGDFEWEGVY